MTDWQYDSTDSATGSTKWRRVVPPTENLGVQDRGASVTLSGSLGDRLLDPTRQNLPNGRAVMYVADYITFLNTGGGGGGAPTGPAGGDLGGTYPNPTVVAIHSSPVPTLASGYLHFNGSVFVWDTPAGGFAAGGDLAGTTTVQEVIGILNKALPALPGSDQYLHYTGSAWVFTALPTSLPPNGAAGGDLTGTYPNPTLSATAVTAGSYGDGTHVGSFTVDAKGRLTAASSVAITGAAPTGSAGGDLADTYPNPHVASISGSGGTAGNIPIGDGVHNILFKSVTSLQTSPPFTGVFGATGYSVAATAGSTGGVAEMFGGIGGAGQGTNMTGGKGGQAQLTGGNGGAATGTAANSNGGDVAIYGGNAGTGGSGAAGAGGNVLIGGAGPPTSAAFATGGVGGVFGIGTTPGTDPTITRGTGVPATTQTNGSLFLRTDGSSGSNGLYVREGGAWFAVGGTTTTNATLTFEGQAFQLASSGNGNGTISWPQAQATPTVTQAQQANGSAPASMLFAPQAPGAGASTTPNGTPGDALFNFAAPVSTGVNAGLKVQQAGTTGISLQQYPGGGYWAVYFGANARAPGASNYSFLCNDAGDTVQLLATATLQLRSFNWEAYSGAGLMLRFDSNGGQLFPPTSGNMQLGGGGYVLGWRQASVVPTSLPTGGGVLYMNSGSPGSLGLVTTGIAFNALVSSPTISQDSKTTDVAPNSLTIQAQNAWASATVNGTGGDISLTSGLGVLGVGNNGYVNITNGSLRAPPAVTDVAPTLFQITGASAYSGATGSNRTGGALTMQSGGNDSDTLYSQIQLNGGAHAASFAASIYMRSGGIGGVPSDPSITHVPWAWTANTLSIAGSGTKNLASAQSATPFLTLTGLITGNTTVAFPNVPGFWLVDLSGVTGFASGTISFSSGSTTKQVTATTYTVGNADSLVVVVTNGSNTIYILGSSVSPL